MTTKDAAGWARRRSALLDLMAARVPSAVALLPSAPVCIRNNDVEHDYRQDSDFFYVMVIDGPERRFTLFVRPRDPSREIWDGPRAGIDGAKTDFGADHSALMAELDDKLPDLLQNRQRVYYRLGKNRQFDDRLLAAIDRVRGRARTGVSAPTEIVDPGTLVHDMRLRKSPLEIETMRRAGEVTREAHELAMARARPGMREYEVEALLIDTFRRRGSERPAYGSIVGSGPNACVLHYRKNDRLVDDGDLLLIDAGCEYDYYASDVTRTFPVSGGFSRAQQAIYEVVLEAQLEAIAAARPGATLEDVHRRSVDVITRGLVRLGVLSGEPEKIIETEGYKRFFMHRTSHWLGMDVHDVGDYKVGDEWRVIDGLKAGDRLMDVHDVGAYFVDGKPRQLEPSMVITVEPGIYIGPDENTVSAEWRGIGVRIEDDVAITVGEPDVLTASIPKTVEDVRRACLH